MKALLFLQVFLGTMLAHAGDSGITQTVCWSESGRTVVVYKTDDYAEDIEASLSLSIDGQMLTNESSKKCYEEGTTECNYVNFDSTINAVKAGAEEFVGATVLLAKDGKSATITADSLDPRTYKKIGFDIDLKCNESVENP